MFDAAERTGDAVGDGTSTATILAQAIVTEGIRNVVAGASAVDLKKGLDRGARAAVERALQVSPGDAKTYHLMGRVLDRMCLPEQAQEMYHRCRDLAGL